MSFSEMLAVLIGCVFVNNYVLVRFVGFEHIANDSKKNAKYNAKVSLLFTLILVIATTITFPLDKWVLIPNGFEWARNLVYVIVIALSVFLVETLIMKRTAEWLKYD